MRSVDANSFTIAEAAHVIPDNLLISKRGPSMCLTLLNEGLYCAASWRNKEGFSRHTVVVGHLTLSLDLVDPVLGEGVPGMFSVVAVKTANAVSSCHITPVTQIRLHGPFGGAVRLLAHY